MNEFTLTEQETGVDTGVFAGAIPSRDIPPAATHFDCVLSVAPETVLTAVYVDPDFPSDIATTTATKNASCPASLAGDDIAGTGSRFSCGSVGRRSSVAALSTRLSASRTAVSTHSSTAARSEKRTSLTWPESTSLKPSFCRPRRFSFGTRRSSKWSAAGSDARTPSFFSSLPTTFSANA